MKAARSAAPNHRSSGIAADRVLEKISHLAFFDIAR